MSMISEMVLGDLEREHRASVLKLDEKDRELRLKMLEMELKNLEHRNKMNELDLELRKMEIEVFKTRNHLLLPNLSE